MKTKVCTKCEVEKEATNGFFAKQKSGKYGLTSKCKDCKKVYTEMNAEKAASYKRNWYMRNKERMLSEAKEHSGEINEQRRKRRASDHEKYRKIEKEYRDRNPDKKKEKNKRYYKKHKGELLRKCKIYYQENTDTIKKRTKEWAKNNPERNKELSSLKWHKYRSKKEKLDFRYTKKDWETCKEHFDYRCAYCNKKEDLTREHFVPVSKEGEFTINNIIPACGSCNSSKGNKLFHEWYPSYEHYSKKREKQILKYLGYNNNIQQLSIL